MPTQLTNYTNTFGRRGYGVKTIKFMCTAFRDGFQSVYGARVFTDDFLPAVEATAEAGVKWFEAGGGARFQSLYFYSNEDAFDMMDRFRKAAGADADLQTLSRGINVVGLESQSSDVIKLHADLFARHGITSIRNFDALNDVDNLIYSGQCIKNAGLKHQVCVTMMELPPGCSGAHTPEFYMQTLQQIIEADIPFDSVCFKDASGTSVPSKVYETIQLAKKILPSEVMVHFHTHETAGIGCTCYMAAIEAGADAIDLSMAPVSGGTCQTDIATMWHALRGSDFTLNVDIDKIIKAEEVFKECMADYFLPPEATMVEPLIPWSPMPGGALTANTQMLRDNGIMHRYPEIIKAMGEVVRMGGFGTSVTPVSQFYFQQAFNNVMFGPWKKIADGYAKMVLGYFGKTPVKPDPELVRISAEQLKMEPTTLTPLKINDKDPKKGLGPARELLEENSLPVTDENLFIAATCKEKGVLYLKGQAPVGVRKKDKEKEKAAGKKPEGYTVTINNNRPVPIIKWQEAGAAPVVAHADGGKPVVAPMPGLVFKIVAPEGSHVEEGDKIMILEAMKMEVDVTAPITGTVEKIEVTEGEHVTAGKVLTHVH